MLKKELEKKLVEYRNIIHKLEQTNLPEIDGTLRISVDGETVRYYKYQQGTNSTSEFIHKKDIEIARVLAQKAYNDKMMELANRRVRQIERILKDYHDKEVEAVFENQHYARKELITPVDLTFNQKLELWINEKYEGKGFKEGEREIYSDRGERVRSKTEKDLANYFYSHNIPYKYEKPLRLNGYGIVYPDFTFLSPKTGNEIYWEHDGQMDDPDYARKAIKKIESYENNGIYLGERLIVTFETLNKILGTKEIERNVRRFLM